LDGTELYSVEGKIAPRSELTLVIERKNGEKLRVPMDSRLDTQADVETYEAGGILPRFVNDVLSKKV